MHANEWLVERSGEGPCSVPAYAQTSWDTLAYWRYSRREDERRKDVILTWTTGERNTVYLIHGQGCFVERSLDDTWLGSSNERDAGWRAKGWALAIRRWWVWMAT